MSELPSVAVVIANWNGAAHLPDCLDSLAALDYPRHRLVATFAVNETGGFDRAALFDKVPGSDPRAPD